MSDEIKTADSKGSPAPSEAGLRNNLNRTMFLILAATAVVIVIALSAIFFYTHRHAGLAQPKSYNTASALAGRISVTSTRLVG